jgi:uncharacterized protein (UPF0128 family)
VKIIIICEARYDEKARPVKEILRKSARDREATVRINVAGNYHTPEETLDELPNDKDMMARINVSRNINTRLETIEKLVEDKRYIVSVHKVGCLSFRT